uniref:Uncharacterized protein n=1 Tax=Anopheles coluzzii TaxID=1518534 RepID=A0A8W7PJ93_ANOCL
LLLLLLCLVFAHGRPQMLAGRIELAAAIVAGPGVLVAAPAERVRIVVMVAQHRAERDAAARSARPTRHTADPIAAAAAAAPTAPSAPADAGVRRDDGLRLGHGEPQGGLRLRAQDRLRLLDPYRRLRGSGTAGLGREALAAQVAVKRAALGPLDLRIVVAQVLLQVGKLYESPATVRQMALVRSFA